ncbi:MAG: iron-sulfur cluster loop [Chloroflexi bacterium]|nr:iron-sulfur cluster loop [Chloroflexota bacterium]
MVADAEHRIAATLIDRGSFLLSRPFEPIQFTGDPEADALLNNLSQYPHAFVTACVMHRQVRAESAWIIPYKIAQRRGSFEFSLLSTLGLKDVLDLMAGPPPLHRFPETMAKNLHSALARIAGEYHGNASEIWAECPSSATIVRRFLEFDGVGPKIATMAANFLVRDFKIAVSDKVSIEISPDVHVRRVFTRLGLISEGASNEVLIYRAREMHPLYPGILDPASWEIGRSWCAPQRPDCEECYMARFCPTAPTKEAARRGDSE